MRGTFEYGRGEPEMAMEYFATALTEDPDFAAAKAGVAGARFLIALDDPEGADGQRQIMVARDEAMAALELDTSSMEAREVLSFIEKSLPHLMPTPPSEPLEVSPNVRVITIPGMDHSVEVDVGVFDTAWVSAVTKLGDRIEATVRRRTEGLGRQASTDRNALQARQLMMTGRFSEAATVLEEVVERAPEATPAWEMLARSQVSAGDPMAAVDVMDRWQESGARGAPDDEWIDQLRQSVTDQGAAGYWARMLDRLETIENSGRMVPQTEIAAASAGMGDHDRALEHLMAAIEYGEPGLFGLRADPVWDELRGDERFLALLQEARSFRFTPASRSRRGGGGGPGGR